MQVVRIASAGQVLLFTSDLVPTRAHVRLAWTMGFDLDVTATVEAKRRLLGAALEGNWLLCLDHDAQAPLVRLERRERRGRTEVVAVPAREAAA